MAWHLWTLLSFTLISTSPSALAAKLPKTFTRCSKTDPNFNSCLNKAVEESIQKLGTGFPKLGLIPLEPLSIPQLFIGEGNGPISLDLKFKNLKIHGITNLKIRDQKTDLERLKLECRSFNKQLVLDGDYEVNGKILLLPVHGKGKSKIILDDVDATNKISGSRITKNGKTYMDVKKYEYKFKTSKMTMNFQDLFNGDKRLSDAMNRILNSNWEEVLREMKPNFENALSEVFKDITNQLYKRVALQDIYLNTTTVA